MAFSLFALVQEQIQGNLMTQNHGSWISMAGLSVIGEHIMNQKPLLSTSGFCVSVDIEVKLS
jgi:hypothetical protein